MWEKTAVRNARALSCFWHKAFENSQRLSTYPLTNTLDEKSRSNQTIAEKQGPKNSAQINSCSVLF